MIVKPGINTVGKPAAADSDQQQVAGVPLSRLIPRELIQQPEIIVAREPRSLAAERFRRLATMLHGHSGQPRTLVVSSPFPSEGKSTVALNLALVLAGEAGGGTLLIDADLRRPTVHTRLKPQPGTGLTEVLTGKATLEHAVYDLKNSPLKVLPAGGNVAHPHDLLVSDVAKQTFAQLRTDYRWVIVDTPPVLVFSDADTLGRQSDGVLMVVRRGNTPQGALDEAVSQLAPTPVLGVVLNRQARTLTDHFGSYYRDSKEYYR